MPKLPRDTVAESQSQKLKAQADALFNTFQQKSGVAVAKLDAQLQSVAADYSAALKELERQLKPFDLLTNALNAGWKDARAMEVQIKTSMDTLYAKVNDMLTPPKFTGDPKHDAGELKRKYGLHLQFEAELGNLNKLLVQTMEAMNRAATATTPNPTGIKTSGDQKAP